MFSDRYGLTRAVLEGRKTMTRRVIKAPRTMEGKDVYGFSVVKYHRTGVPVELMALDADGAQINNIVPKYMPGEVVAVARAYKDCVNEILVNWEHKTDIGTLAFKMSKGWNNKMFVRADLMPHQIRITGVRVERLQDISDEDCLREGILEDCPGVQYSFPTEIGYCGQYPFGSPRDAFAALIDRISGKGTWEKNPWVFVYEFELVKNQDKVC